MICLCDVAPIWGTSIFEMFVPGLSAMYEVALLMLGLAFAPLVHRALHSDCS